MNAFVTENAGYLWLSALSVGAAALLLAGYLWLRLRRYRRDQRVVMGKEGRRDIVAHARDLEQRLDSLDRQLQQLDERLAATGERLDSCFTHRSLIRYDAYRDLSGMQSTSVALLDAHFSGVIISAIQSRDHARIYVKEVRHGESREKLSPEEEQVFKEAMGLERVETGHPRSAGGEGVA